MSLYDQRFLAWTQAPEMESPESPTYEPDTDGEGMEVTVDSPAFEPSTDNEELEGNFISA